MGSLLVVTGPPGAGKSTVARLLADRGEPSVLVTGDSFFGFLARGAIPPWLPESNDQNDIVIRASGVRCGPLCVWGVPDVERRHLLLDPPERPRGCTDLVTAALSSGALAYRSSPS